MSKFSEEDYIRRVESLLERANHPETPEPERQSALALADEVMARHRLDRALLFQSGKKPEREILHKKYAGITLTDYLWIGSSMRRAIFDHCGVSTYGSYTLEAVGYEEDLFYAEMLWSEVLLHFTRSMFPTWDNFRSFDANVYRIKSAGYSWSQVRDMGLAQNASDYNGPLTEKNAGSKLRTAFKREAKRLGEEVLPGKQQPIRPKIWRKSFAEAYASKLTYRLWEMASKNKEAAGKEGEIALQSDADRVKNRFWEIFPELHPDAMRRRLEELEREEEARRESLTEAERKREDEENKRSSRKYIEKMDKEHDRKGAEAGRKAASEVNLSRSNRIPEAERQAIDG